MASEETVKIGMECACKKVQAPLEVPASALPLPLYLCHCNSCSSVSGQLCATVVGVPPGGKLSPNGKAKSYKTSSLIERFFCDNCGTSVYEDASGMAPGMMFLETGAFTTGEAQVGGKSIPVFTAGEQVFVEDSKDGGCRDWLPNMPAWEGWFKTSAAVPEGKLWGSAKPQPSDTGDVPGRCHCGGVELSISRPTTDKYGALLCACGACRRGSGIEFSAWAVIPNSSLDWKNTSTLKQYVSSEGCRRGFCSGCGATTSFTADKLKGMTLVAVGMLNDKNAKSGHRNQDILKWRTDSIPFASDAQNKAFIGDLQNGLKAWGDQAAAA